MSEIVSSAKPQPIAERFGSTDELEAELTHRLDGRSRRLNRKASELDALLEALRPWRKMYANSIAIGRRIAIDAMVRHALHTRLRAGEDQP